MNKSVILYAIECTKAHQKYEQGRGFSLSPWGCNTEHYEGNDDGGHSYLLPEGYSVATVASGESAIFDPDGNHCEILRHSSDRPQLASISNSMPVLRRA